jgi:hypothetical protein
MSGISLPRIASTRPIRTSLVIAVLSIFLFLTPPAGVAEPADQTVVIELPLLSPDPGDLCTTFWYDISPPDEYDGYLTLNVSSPGSSTNHGEWQADLPLDGIYLVEAFIPAHDSIFWDCPNFNETISSDTADARYTVQSETGARKLSADQASSSGGWLSLGEHRFTAEGGARVILTDLNDEANLSSTISFSALRFIWLRELTSEYQLFLPAVGQNVNAQAIVTHAWTTDAVGRTKSAFIPDEPVIFTLAGLNSFGRPLQADALITLTTPCDSTTVFSGTIDLEPDNWTYVHEAVTPECYGISIYDIQIHYRDQISEFGSALVVNQPSQSVVSDEPAFDKCNIPSLSQLQAWWDESPYGIVNLYIGGVSRACANVGLTPFWVHAASQQGWTFIPTWVGPQAACSKFKNRMSYNPDIAYLQGRSEADAAWLAAYRLGLGDSVIYYDLEAYSSDIAPGCREAAQAFMNGWTERLHQLGVRSGGYGSPRGSYMADWAEITHPPDLVWIAVWYGGEWYYNPAASVWVPAYLSNSLWPDNQRIRQYTGGHNETWGGVTMNIDSNVTRGEVALLPDPLEPAGVQEEPGALAEPISNFQLLPSGEGWVLSGGRLLWSADGGVSWQDITPFEAQKTSLTAASETPDSDPLEASSAGASILNAHFIEKDLGWVIARSETDGALIALTNKGESGWSESVLPFDTQVEAHSPIQHAYLDFIDPLHGWVSLRLPSGSNFSLGVLFATSDGGQSWQRLPLPLGEPVRFNSPLRGWVAGGPAGDQLFFTDDGGQTWDDQVLTPPTITGEVYYDLPLFTDQLSGMLAVTIVGEDQTRVYLYTTEDGGLTWSQPGGPAVVIDEWTDGPFRLEKRGDQLWLTAPSGASLPVGDDGAEPIPYLQAPIAGHFVQASIAGDSLGWALAQQGLCSGYKLKPGEEPPSGAEPWTCELRTALYRTTDAGLTWQEITIQNSTDQ